MGQDTVETDDREPREVEHVQRRMVCGVEPHTIGVDEADRGDEALAFGEQIRAVVVDESIAANVFGGASYEVGRSNGFEDGVSLELRCSTRRNSGFEKHDIRNADRCAEKTDQRQNRQEPSSGSG